MNEQANSSPATFSFDPSCQTHSQFFVLFVVNRQLNRLAGLAENELVAFQNNMRKLVYDVLAEFDSMKVASAIAPGSED
jgi:hypothetical protein